MNEMDHVVVTVSDDPLDTTWDACAGVHCDTLDAPDEEINQTLTHGEDRNHPR